jgi:hypothetical protein
MRFLEHRRFFRIEAMCGEAPTETVPPSYVTIGSSPVLVAAAAYRAQKRFIEFFTANIRNRNTRRAYAQAVSEFLAWCEHHPPALDCGRAAGARCRLHRGADPRAIGADRQAAAFHDFCSPMRASATAP